MLEVEKINKSGVHYHEDSFYGDIKEEDFIIAGERLGLMKSDIDGEEWWVAISPRNHNYCAEGSWKDFVELAKIILEKDANKQ